MSTPFSAFDGRMMARALELAARGLYSTDPNPRVGCVLTRDERIVGEGWHERAGEPHAEVHALRAAGADAQGATAYVSLEPCNHQGRTGPCAQALIDAGVARVVVAMRDPNPLVAGGGIQRLRDAGVEVLCGLMEPEARALNPGFISRMERGRPYVRLKLAMSVDGRTAMATGESQWITGPAARSDVQKLRARSSAILTGSETVLHDDCSLTLRAAELGLPDAEALCRRQPLRVVLDSQLRIAPSAKIFHQRGETLVVSAKAQGVKRWALQSAGAEVLELEGAEGRIDLRALMDELARRACNEVLVECGPTLAAALLDAELVDELVLYMAPILMGSEARGLFNLPLGQMAEKRHLRIESVRAIGEDWRLIIRPDYSRRGQ